MSYQEIEVNLYRRDNDNIPCMINVNMIRSYQPSPENRTRILFKDIDFVVIDEPFLNFKERMSYLYKDDKDANA